MELRAGRVHPCGDAAVLIDVEPELRQRFVAALTNLTLPGVVDIVPGERSVLITLEPLADLPSAIDSLAALDDDPTTASRADGDELVIPVRYDGPDLAATAELVGLSERELVATHTSGEYAVAFVGFAPGFAYLDGLPPALRVPRLATPRTKVDPGSVAIAGNRSCIYPGSTPGGWRILGHTDAVLFDVRRTPPSPLRAGRRVKFVSDTS